MTSFIQNILWNSVSGFVEAGTRTAGGYAGDALIKAGDMIENSGRGFGDGIERRATTYGSSISGQTYQPAAKAQPSTARKLAIKRSNSTPANAKPGSKTSVGAKQSNGAGVSAASKSVTGGAKGVVGGVTGGAKGAVGGVTGGAKSTVGGATGGARGTLGGLTGGAYKGAGGIVGGAQKQLGGAQKAVGSTASTASKQLPKPYPNNMTYPSKMPGSQAANALPKPYNNTSAYPTEKKTSVKPGAPKPFTPPAPKNGDGGNGRGGAGNKAPYPGTNTLPGQGSNTPVKKYKPMERLPPPAEKGKMTHVSF